MAKKRKGIKIFDKFIIFLGSVFLMLLILSLVLFLAIKHLKIKDIVEKEIESSLGINASISSIEFSPLLTHIAAKNVTIHNPDGFPEDELAYLEYIHFVCDPVEILVMKKPYIYLFALDLKRLNIIKNKQGKVNIKEIEPIKETNASEGKSTPFIFGAVILSVDRIRYVNYTQKNKKESIYKIGMKNAVFLGLKDNDSVVKMIIYKAIENTNIGKTINLTVVPVVSNVKETMDSAWGTAKTGAKGIWGIITMPVELLTAGSKD